MKSFWTLLLIGIPFLTFSQKNKTFTVDSASFYKKEVSKAYKQAFDSLEQTELFLNYLKFQQRHNNYFGFSFFFNALHSDYTQFNKAISVNGFPAMQPMSYGFGYAFAGKYKHIITDFGVSLAGQNTSKKPGETIGSGLYNILFDIGYEVLSSDKISIYPFGGISMRFATLNYKREGTVNATYNDISDLLVNNQSINASSNRLGYQAGLGIDAAIWTNKNNNKSILLFTKAGVNQPFKADKYKAEGINNYNPKINKGNWMISFGIKLTRRFNRPS